ncbi:hypothetical protein VNI00_007120 [Paramarasmius palmivorus]|uniref:Heme haloperoxidase family profile domain-containing protein n=1 Tax=Paramarasmius palmivorus TaxID=297713 RepID=A0AAW0D0S9_9AGAR
MAYGTFYTPQPKQSLPAGHLTIKSTHAGRTCPVSSHTGQLHEYREPQQGDVRSVCPALNTMANHGYIPRDGQNLTFSTICSGLKACYGLSTPLAIFLTLGGFLLIGRLPFALPFGIESLFSPRNPDGSKLVPGVINLHLIGLHGGTEHDASLVHDDCEEGKKYPSIEVREDWVENVVGDVVPKVEGYPRSRAEKTLSLLSTSSTPYSTLSKATPTLLAPPDESEGSTRSPSRGSSVTAVEESDLSSLAEGWRKFATAAYRHTLVSSADVGRMRVRRQREILPKKLDAVHEEIARGEMAIILGVWEKETYVENDEADPVNTVVVKRKKGIPLPWLLTWLAEERLPEGWKPDHVQGLLDVARRSKEIRTAARAEEAGQRAH